MSVEKYRKSGASAKPDIFAATYEAVADSPCGAERGSRRRGGAG